MYGEIDGKQVDKGVGVSGILHAPVKEEQIAAFAFEGLGIALDERWQLLSVHRVQVQARLFG